MQQWYDRHYVHSNILLKVVSVDALKKWNAEKNMLQHDKRFIRMMLLDVFGTKLLKSSSLAELDANKIRFIQGFIFHVINHLLYEKQRIFIGFSRYFPEESSERHCTPKSLLCYG